MTNIMKQLVIEMERLSKSCQDASIVICEYRRAVIICTRPYSKQRLPRKLKKAIKKEAESNVFELQFEVY
jgi:hypothetical protein